MLRILHVVRNMNTGGIETTLVSYNEEIIEYDVLFDYLILSSNRAHFHDKIIQLNSKVFYIGELRILNVIYRFLALLRFFKSNSYQIVHFHLDSNSFIPLLAAYFTGVKVRVAHSHTSKSKNHRLLRSIFNSLIPIIATDLIACNVNSGKYMFKDNPYQIMNNIVNQRRFQFNNLLRTSLREEFDIQSKFVLGYVGSLVEEKNTEFLIFLIDRLKETVQNAVLLIIGDGPKMVVLKKMVLDKNLDEYVIFLGRRSDVYVFYNAFDVFLLPSKFEGSPVVVWEAGINGLPIILSDNISMDIEIENVRKFSIHEVNEWIESLSKVQSNPERKVDLKLLDLLNVNENVKKLIGFYNEKI